MSSYFRLTLVDIFVKKYCCIIFHVFLLTEISTCQTKCEVKIENVSATKNLLWDIEFGTPNTKFLTPCQRKGGYKVLTMFINCPNWNAGKCIRQGNQFSINILPCKTNCIFILLMTHPKQI